MKIELLGALDYVKLKEYLSDKVDNSDEIVSFIKGLEIERRTGFVATAGRLSRFPGNVFEILNTIEKKSFDKNIEFVKMVTTMGHDSITDHDYCVFALQDVSSVIEQTIIAERFSSFTIKSRREVDFSKVGFYTPDFHDENGNLIKNNEAVKQEYKNYMNTLFKKYEYFTKMGISKEDARFVLPYSYNSNIIMGVDAHTLKDMIIKFTKTKYSKIQEIKEFGDNLYEIAKVNMPYIIDGILKTVNKETDFVDDYLKSKIDRVDYEIIEKPKLINHSTKIDDSILISAIMRRYQYDYNKASQIYNTACNLYPKFKDELMRKIVFDGDKLELTQVSFEFQIPLSFAVLTHLTRHRTHHIIVPDFVPVVDLMQYKIPPKFKGTLKDELNDTFKKNKKMYDHFKHDYGIRDEDLVYFTLSGNMVNIVTNMDGKTVEHILGLRQCNKAQWETRKMANDMHEEIKKLDSAKAFSSILGATCETQGYCKEGKESCGKILTLQKNK